MTGAAEAAPVVTVLMIRMVHLI